MKKGRNKICGFQKIFLSFIDLFGGMLTVQYLEPTHFPFQLTFIRCVVVTQSVERSLSTSKIRGSNPVIDKIYLLPTVLKRRK